jgi:hypothetical protein
MRHQCPQQLLAIDPVGLRAPGSLIDRNTRGIEHMVGNPGRSQKAMQPEPVVARFVATHHRRRRAQHPPRPLAHSLNQRQQTDMVAAIELVPRHPIAIRTVDRHQPTPLAQFKRNENPAIIPVDGRAYVGCLHLTSPMVQGVETEPTGGTPIAPWYLRAASE